MKAIVLAAALLLAPSSAVLAQQDGSKGATNPATQDYLKAMQGMSDAMQGMKPSNDPDMDFVMMMKPHHEAAVQMARAYLNYGTDPKLKAMARDIVRSQNKEIRQMDAWEARHGM